MTVGLPSRRERYGCGSKFLLLLGFQYLVSHQKHVDSKSREKHPFCAMNGEKTVLHSSPTAQPCAELNPRDPTIVSFDLASHGEPHGECVRHCIVDFFAYRQGIFELVAFSTLIRRRHLSSSKLNVQNAGRGCYYFERLTSAKHHLHFGANFHR